MNILLRPWLAKDLEPLVAFANNKKIFDNVRDAFPHPYMLQNAKEWLSLNVGITPVLNFVIEVDGNFVGSIGMVPKADVYHCNMEIGYWLGEPYWGKGIATEAIRLLEVHILNYYPHINRIYAEVFETNAASILALQKNGFVQEATRRNAVIKNGIFLDDYVFVKLKP